MRRVALLGICVATLAATARADELSLRPQNVVVDHRAPGAVPSVGPRHAPVTIEYFFDPGISTSKRPYRLLHELAERHPTRLRVVFRVLPRTSNLTPEAALEAFAQGRFEAFVRELHERRRVSSHGEIEEVAAAAGMDLTRLGEALRDARHDASLQHSERLRWRRGVRARPGLLINGRPPTVSVRSLTIDSLEAHYDEAHAEARDVLAEGVPLAALYDELLTRRRLADHPLPVRPGVIDGGDDDRADEREPTLLPTPLATRGLPARGAANPRVEVVFLCNFLSPNCRNMKRTLDDLHDLYPDTVRIFFHPLFDPDEPSADGAALLHEAGLCAAEHDAFWRFYDEKFDRQAYHARSELAPIKQIVQIAEAIELTDEGFQRCVESGRHALAVETRVREARLAGIRHTPALVIGGRAYTGTKRREDIIALVNEELTPGLLERWLPGWALAEQRSD